MEWKSTSNRLNLVCCSTFRNDAIDEPFRNVTILFPHLCIFTLQPVKFEAQRTVVNKFIAELHLLELT